MNPKRLDNQHDEMLIDKGFVNEEGGQGAESQQAQGRSQVSLA